MDSIIINKEVFKRISDTYYISLDGKVYSTYSRKIIKTLYRLTSNGTKKYAYVDISFNGKQKHMPIHRLVYSAWIGSIPDGMQVNHKDDNSLNNKYTNLYAGSQKSNIEDCISNGHRVGNIFYLTVYDKKANKTVTFCPAGDFISYSGHTNKSGCLNKFFNKNWFKKRYDILEFKRINNLDELKGVTTMGDECSPVE